MAREAGYLMGKCSCTCVSEAPEGGHRLSYVLYRTNYMNVDLVVKNEASSKRLHIFYMVKSLRHELKIMDEQGDDMVVS